MDTADSADLWRSAMDLFLRALDREERERAAWVTDACKGDAKLAAAVHRLLETDGRLQSSPLPDLAALRDVAAVDGAELAEGDVLGAYRIVRKIGDGGMGSVFLGERRDGRFEQQVAIKVLRAALGDPMRIARFHLERRILARLSHPAIARLIDGGETPRGLPYLVMEHVPGAEPLTDFCRGRALPTPPLIRLFLRVCAGIEYAHRNLVIHRDVKPSNILVDAEGLPRVLDFGIAKLLAPEGQASERGETLALTPDYASPEQILGRDLTTTTDIYSLGVLLYELLTGRRPFARGDAENLTEALAAPPRPPSRVSPARAPELRGELDAITLKALAFEPEERYASVAELAEDLRRHLGGRPVRAVGDGRWYRTRKLVRRHRATFVAAALALALAVAYVATALVQARRMQQERDVAARVTEFLVESYERVDPSQTRGESLTAREVLDDAVRRIDDELGDQPQVKSRLQKTLAEVYFSLGLFEPAAGLVRQARELLANGGRERSPEYAEASLLEARLLHRDAEYAEALTRLERAQAIFAAGGDRAAEARVRHAEAAVRYDQGHREEALALDRQALALETDVLGPEHLQSLAGAFAVSRRLAVLGHAEEAATLQDDTLARLRAHGLEVHPLTAELLRQIAVRERRAGRLESAERHFDSALGAQRALYGLEHPSIARTLSSFANLRATQRRYEEARRLFDEAIAMSESVFGRDETYAAIIWFNRGSLLQRMGRNEEAEADIRRALALREAILGDGTWKTVNTAFFLAGHGESLLAIGRVEEAAAAAERSLEVWRTRDQFDDRNGCLARIILGEVHLQRGELAAAARHLEPCGPILAASTELDPMAIERGVSRLERLNRLTGRAVESGPSAADG